MAWRPEIMSSATAPSSRCSRTWNTGVPNPQGVTLYQQLGTTGRAWPFLADDSHFHNGNPDEDLAAYDNDFLWYAYQNFGTGVPVVFLAHEWGHAIAARMTWTSYMTQNTSSELTADCLAGAFSWYLQGNGYLPGTVWSEVASFLATYNNDHTPGGDGPDSHGTYEERISALDYGFNYGVDNCRGYLF
jgi:hypothetical protein